MKGNPMKRNFGIGSPLHQNEVKRDDKASGSNIMQADDDYNKMKKSKGSIKTRLTERYGGDWSKKEGATSFTNEKGQTATQAEANYLDASKNVG